jgi:hypothetical protein
MSNAIGTDRKSVLLRAAYDLLKRADAGHFVEEATCILVRYDEADCDGHCLMEDIAHELELEDGTKPIPLVDE